MAHIDDNSSNGRTVNMDVNIVPFIDLMSVLVIFLLITAVWSQVSMIQIGSSIYGKRTEAEDSPPPPRAEVAFRVDVKSFGYQVLIGRKLTPIPKLNGKYDEDSLLENLRTVKKLYPEKNDCVITVEDELPYESLVTGMDNLLKAGFPEISIATGGAE
ncbi:MAG: biopolymer transporter ExbD [Bdellovibrionales bacterium]|nr:biopolymer transporter ExbD [Bdellovibrionales bacterium]